MGLAKMLFSILVTIIIVAAIAIAIDFNPRFAHFD